MLEGKNQVIYVNNSKYFVLNMICKSLNTPQNDTSNQQERVQFISLN